MSLSSDTTASPSPLRPKSLPDIDDVSMNQLYHYLNYAREDLYWSFFSDSLFVCGGIGYLVLSIYPEDMQDDGSNYVYAFVEWLAPFVYVLNSVVDIAWAQNSQQREKVKKQVTATWSRWQGLLMDDNQKTVEDDETMDEEKEVPQSMIQRLLPPWCNVCRKHTAHRRTTLAAMTFGNAALFAVLALPSSDYWANVLNSLSVHLYIVSAIVAVSGKRARPCCSASKCWHPETLEDLGDLMFLVGSVGDGILCDLTFDDDTPTWSILSAMLWLIDAALYFCADVIMARRIIQKGRRHDAGGILV